MIRDQKIIQRLRGMVLTPEDFLDLFPSVDAAGHRLKILSDKGKIKRVGFVYHGNGGRPAYAYSRRVVKVDWVEHDLGLSRFLLLYAEAEIVMGYACDRQLRPDAEMTLKVKILVEYLTGTMRLDHVARKTFGKYRKYRRPVLFVCITKRYMDGLLKRAEKVAHCAHFGLVSEAQKSPYGTIWTDFYGNLSALENPNRFRGA